jgi:hypothetical protein
LLIVETRTGARRAVWLTALLRLRMFQAMILCPAV